MRKIVLILACVAMAVQAMGQAAPNRTWKTKVSDALGLMPAPDPAEYNRLMGDLLSTGSQGVDMLVSMFDGTNNVPVAYALSGWAAFVSSGHEADRKVFAEGIVRGLDCFSRQVATRASTHWPRGCPISVWARLRSWRSLRSARRKRNRRLPGP